MRLPGDVAFAAGALLMAWDFLIKLGPLYPAAARRLRILSSSATLAEPGNVGAE
jgi:nitric oxide reductase subunit B